jgi:hypothetical protein
VWLDRLARVRHGIRDKCNADRQGERGVNTGSTDISERGVHDELLSRIVGDRFLILGNGGIVAEAGEPCLFL